MTCRCVHRCCITPCCTQVVVPNPSDQASYITAKYGVIEAGTACQDLAHWRHMYFSGRTQKAVLTLQHDARIHSAIQQNREIAAAAALLLAGPDATVRAFMEQLVGLSYMGDFRMIIGEHPQKISNIVQGSGAAMWDIYQPILAEQAGLAHMPTQWRAAQQLALHHAPSWASAQAKPAPVQTAEFIAYKLRQARVSLPAHAARAQDMVTLWAARPSVQSQLAWRVATSSIAQALRGIVSAGVGKSLTYAAAKVRKTFKA